ncbi:MAG TPA: mevalonate kinase [Anaerolineales bacterium]|nr:mevalonate kinase [Anaerolineales bacterium]
MVEPTAPNVFVGTAVGKAILCGEHAVVYGKPAIAIPVTAVQARAELQVHEHCPLQILADDLGVVWRLTELSSDHFVRTAIEGCLSHLGKATPPDGTLRLTSSIPIASGLGSSAAIATALIRCIAAWAGAPLTPAQTSELAYAVEKIQHGTPSGIDNTVIAYETPVWYIKGSPPEPLENATEFHLLLADSGEAGSTKQAVSQVRTFWQANSVLANAIFHQIAEISLRVKERLALGIPYQCGELLSENHALLAQLGVSTPKLDHLVKVAQQAGAVGAKLSGGGLGGNLLALVTDAQISNVKQALLNAGAKKVLATQVKPTTILQVD